MTSVNHVLAHTYIERLIFHSSIAVQVQLIDDKCSIKHFQHA